MSKEQPIDVRDMAIVHRAFRTSYAESARLVRAASTPSPARVEFLADHIDFGISVLHHHHESEDALLYPKIIERVPEQAPMTEEVEHEHEAVAAVLDDASRACAAWRAAPSKETNEALAVALDKTSAELERHLDDEEQKVVPLAAVTLTQEEWDKIGEHAVSLIPRDQRPIAFGMITESCSEADRAYMKRPLPAVVKMLYPILMERPYAKYSKTLRSGS